MEGNPKCAMFALVQGWLAGSGLEGLLTAGEFRLKCTDRGTLRGLPSTNGSAGEREAWPKAEKSRSLSGHLGGIWGPFGGWGSSVVSFGGLLYGEVRVGNSDQPLWLALAS